MVILNKFYRGITLPFILIVGIIRQILSIKIFQSLKDWKATCKIYYLSIAGSDLVYLIGFGLPEWTFEGLDIVTFGFLKFKPENLSSLSCRLFRFAWHSSWFISYWTLVAYSVERIIAISFPFIRVRFISTRNAKVICAMIIVIASIGFLPVIVTNVVHLKYEDSFKDRYSYLTDPFEHPILGIWLLIMPLSCNIILPPILLVIINLILMIQLKSQTKKRGNLMRKPFGRMKLDQSGQNAEIKAAKDLTVISLVTLAIAFPTLFWVPTLIVESSSIYFLFILSFPLHN